MQPNRINTKIRNSASPRNISQNLRSSNTNQFIYNDELVNLINILSDSIKEYYKVCKNILKNKSTLIASMEFQVNQTNSLVDNLMNEDIDINKISQIKESTSALQNIYNKLQLNFVSDEKNLTFFFEDAKILFRKMRTKRQENIKNFYQKINRYYTPMNQSRVSPQIRNSKSVRNEQVNFLDSNVNLEVGGIYNKENIMNGDYNMQNAYKNNFNSSISGSKKKSNHSALQQYPESFNNCFYGKFPNDDNNKTLNKNQINKRSAGNYVKKSVTSSTQEEEEMNKLKKMNKQYFMYIQKLKKEISNYQMNLEKYKNSNNSNEIRKINVNNNMNNNRRENAFTPIKYNNLIGENKKLIARYDELLKSYKKSQEISKKIIEENNRLRRMNLNTKNNSSSKEQFNNNENINNSVYLNSINKLKNDLEISNKKLSEVSNQLTNERAKSLSLQTSLNKSKLEFKKEIDLKTKKNIELSKFLANKNNDFLALQKENCEKNNLIINLKNTINTLSNRQSIEINNDNKAIQNYRNSNTFYENAPTLIDSNSNKIIEDLKKENEQLRLLNQKYEINISQYKTQLNKSLLSDVSHKENSDNSFVFMKKYYDTMKEELENRNQMLLKELNECRNLNESLNKQIENLIQDNNMKELNLQKVNDIQNQLYAKEEENKKLLNTINNSKIKNGIGANNNQLQKNNDDNLINEINKLKNENELLIQKITSNNNNNLNDNDLILENQSLKSDNEKLHTQINKLLQENSEIEETNKNNIQVINKQKDEISGLNQLIYKIQADREKIDEEIKILKKENEKLKKQLEHLSSTLPEEFNELQKQYNLLENKLRESRGKSPNEKLSKSNNSISNNDTNNLGNLVSDKCSSFSANNEIEKLNKELQEAKNQISNLKKKNEALVTQLEEKEIKKECYDNKSEDGNLSNYEEEFDLRKMAKGAKDKNRSQDINIDYPGIQQIKEKYRELDFYYNSLEGLVKKLLLTIKCNPKNKTYITELCRIVGFDLDTTNKIVANKNTKTLLGFFPK